MRLLGVIPAGASPTSDESADALISMVDMIDEWQLEPLMIYAIRDEAITLVSSQNSYDLGPSGDLVTTRPVRITAAYVLVSGNSYPVKIIDTPEEYAAITSKTSESDWPTHVYYKPDMPDGTLYVYPEATDTAAVLHVLTNTPLTVYTSLSDTISLPPGYRKAIASNLALELAPEYETQPSAEVVKMARESKANIKRANARPIKAFTELAALLGGGHSNIQTG
jgi:hypothetical protein